MRVAYAVPAMAGIALAAPFNPADYIMAAINNGSPQDSTTASRTSTATAAATGLSRTSTISASATPTGSSDASEPCLMVSRHLAQQTGKARTVDATLAYDCLRSVPLALDLDLVQLEGLQALAQFQSTLAYLRDPPEGYLYPGVDVLDSLEEMANALNNTEYENEYDFQMDLMDLIQSGQDEHFNYLPDITQVFTFIRSAQLFSISNDSLSIPEVYIQLPGEDILDSLSSEDQTVSPVAQIDGVDVETWLNNYALTEGRAQDPDNNYNGIFRSIPIQSPSEKYGTFAASPRYQGAGGTIVMLQNGTELTIRNHAATEYDFTDVVDGQSFFEQFCASTTTSSDDEDTSADSTATSTTTPVIPTTEVPFRAIPSQTADLGPEYYPIPWIINDDWTVAGYFSDNDGSSQDDGHYATDDEQVAILSIPSFEPKVDAQFSNVIRQFLASAQAANKTRLIVDLRGNGGGNVNLAYDTFAQLFPNIKPYGATNFRATPLLNDLGQVISGFYANVSNATAPSSYCDGGGSDANFAVHPFNFREEYDMDQERFTSWEAFFGPYEHHGDNFTALDRFDLDDKFSLFCSNVSNNGNLTHITPQVFTPENTLIIQDGTCASTCAVFSEFMKSQAGVKTVVFGGRKQTGPMQGVGGVKGANVYDMAMIQDVATQAYEHEATDAQQSYLMDTYGNLTIPMQVALDRALSARINIRNNIRLGDESVTPLQFVYEAADCRLFYTAEMLSQQSLVWQAARDVYWGDENCVVGSTAQESSGLSVDVVPADSANWDSQI